MIKTVIFDLDNTLYNFDSANKAGFRALADYAEPALGWDIHRIRALYEEARIRLAAKIGDTGAAHNRLIRLQNLLEEHDLPIHPHALLMAKAYWRAVLEAMEITPGAEQTLRGLKDRGLRVGLGTDMTSYMQYEKMNRLGLMPYMDFIVSSEEASADKPARAFFSLCIEKARCLPEECLFIGDNVIRDYGGAAGMGLQARWFIPSWKEKSHQEGSLLSSGDGIFPETSGRDLPPGLAAAFRDPQAPESRKVLEAIPVIHALTDVLDIVDEQS